jgi:hypothetical protein
MSVLITQLVPDSPSSMELMGEHNKSFTSFEKALDYLRQYPFGTVEHPDMDILAFLYLKDDGQPAFVDVEHKTVGVLRTEDFIDSILTVDELAAFSDPEIWDQSKFVYMDGTEMACRIDGLQWFANLRSDLSKASNPALPAF